MEEKRETRNLNIIFNKSGNGYYNPRVSLPSSWIKEMGIDMENREIEVTFNGKEIIIKKLNKL